MLKEGRLRKQSIKDQGILAILVIQEMSFLIKDTSENQEGDLTLLSQKVTRVQAPYFLSPLISSLS